MSQDSQITTKRTSAKRLRVATGYVEKGESMRNYRDQEQKNRISETHRQVWADAVQLGKDSMPVITEHLLGARLLNEANPVEYAAKEYLCAMQYLDDIGKPRNDSVTGRVLSLVGRIKA